MYRPSYTQQNDIDQLLDFAQAHGFATIISPAEISHLPLLVEKNGAQGLGILWGHMARANPHSNLLARSEATVIFHGPHSYISPRLYNDPLNVPTWNYAVVHARCRATMVDDPDGIINILKKTVEHNEKETPARWNKQPWTYDLPEDFNLKLVKAIVGFRLEIIQIDGKFKLSQNRGEEDFDGVYEAFQNARSDNDRELFELMEKF